MVTVPAVPSNTAVSLFALFHTVCPVRPAGSAVHRALALSHVPAPPMPAATPLGSQYSAAGDRRSSRVSSQGRGADLAWAFLRRTCEERFGDSFCSQRERN